MTYTKKYYHRPDRTQEVANALLQTGCVLFRPEAPFIFGSSIISPVYIDTYQMLGFPAGLKNVAEVAYEKVTVSSPDFFPEVVAGVAVGGIPFSTAMGIQHARPSCFFRKQAKGYGLSKNVEGANVNGKRTVVIEDVITTGTSALEAIRLLQKAGAEVVQCVAIAGFDLNIRKKFAEVNVPLTILASFGDILKLAVKSGRYSEWQISEVARWYANPHKWYPKHVWSVASHHA